MNPSSAHSLCSRVRWLKGRILVLRYSCNSKFRYQNTCSFPSLYCTVQCRQCLQVPILTIEGHWLRCSCLKKISYFAHQIVVFFHTEVVTKQWKAASNVKWFDKEWYHFAWYQQWLPCLSGTILSVQTKPLIVFCFVFLTPFYQKKKKIRGLWMLGTCLFLKFYMCHLISVFCHFCKEKTPFYLFFV